MRLFSPVFPNRYEHPRVPSRGEKPITRQPRFFLPFFSKDLRSWAFTLALILLLIGSMVERVHASGEINFVHAPSEIPAGDDITIAISASAREANVDRTIAIEFPSTWKFKRAWRVEAGSDHTEKIAPYSEVRSMLSAEAGESVIALADYTSDFDPKAAGIGYFVVFSIGENKEAHAIIKTALVERISLDAIPKVDPRTKRPIEEDHSWKMTFPPQHDFSFASIAGKRLSTSVDVAIVPRTQRALLVNGGRTAFSPMVGRPELINSFFRHSFSIAFWYRTNTASETLLRFTSGNNSHLELGVGLLGQLMLLEGGKTVLAGRAITNDGLWHYAVLSNDSIGTLRLFVDDELTAMAHRPSAMFRTIDGLMLGDSSAAPKDFSIDELHFLRVAVHEPSEFLPRMTVAATDSSHPALALFHFDGYSAHASSSIAETAPLYFELDSVTRIQETTSPVELEPVTLSAELPSPSTVHLEWWRTSELGIKEYRLELRVGSYGPFEAFSTVPARHGMKTPERGEPIISWQKYSALEELPKMNGDIDLYFRVAAMGFGKKDLPQYSLPVKVEYASDRDVFVEQNNPEPFRDTTTIAFTLTKPELVHLSVFDMIGREIAVLSNDRLDPGRHVFHLKASGWPDGIYFYKLKTARATITRKMSLVR